MRALRVHGWDGWQDWRIDDVPAPEPGPTQVLIKVKAVAPSFVDLLYARGGYQLKPHLPLIPGSEIFGVIERCGAKAPAHLTPGTPVMGMVFGGAWADLVCAEGHQVCPVSQSADPAQAATLAAPYGTAHYALVGRARLAPGESVLVLGATGSVGMAAIQVAKALGARVIAGINGVTKQGAVEAAGADAVVDLSQANWKETVRAWSGAEGVDVVLDPLGDRFTDPAFRTLQWGGRHLVIGFAAGRIPELRTNLALLKGALVGVDVRQYMEREPAAYQATLASVAALFEQGLLRPLVHAVYPADQWRTALTTAEDRQTVGRVVMNWD